jgi:DNA-binding transcriptional LysR family regulator
MNIQELDLNLLLVFNAIYVEKSISAAAKKLGLTQPAVSNALKRLRDFTGDPLFYKSGRGVAPTRAAVILSIPIGHALDTVERGLTSVRSFDPSTSTRTFRIGVNDLIHDILVPTLVPLVRREAPGIRLELKIQSPEDGMLTALTRGTYDLALLPGFGIGQDHVSTKIWDEDIIIILGRDHPLARVGHLTVEMLREMEFAVTTHVPRLRQFLDEIFKANGVERKVVCAVADTRSLYPLVAISDLAACVGRHFAEQYGVDGNLVTLDPPFKIPAVSAHIVWSREADADLGHKWIRDQVIDILRSAFKLDAGRRRWSETVTR